MPFQALAFNQYSNNLPVFQSNISSLEQTKNAPAQVDTNQSVNTSQVKNTNSISKDSYVPGEILVKYKNTKINLQTVSGRTAALNFIRTKSLEKKEDLRKNNISVLRIKDAKTVEQKIAELKNDPNIEYAEPNYKRYPAVINTDDTNKVLLWGLDNTGQTVGGTYTTNNPGSTDKDIDGPEAWAISEATTSVSVIVAVIDSGVAYNHPDLAANMWDGTSCKDDIGVAITGGCNHGYDYEDGDNTPLPTISSHGTHIAGTIAAVKNNTKGIMGVAPQAKIMAIKYGNDIASEVRAIDFAIQNGAKVINASFTGADFSQSEYDAINRFKTAGGIFVAAAGNETTNNESVHLYPSDYNLDNIISVAATDQNDSLTTFSNYGSVSVDVGAPGTNIYSTVADSSMMSENFNSVTTPNLPSGWVKGGTNNKWATYDFSGDKVLYGQVPSFPYDDNATTTVTSPSVNLSGASGATISFYTQCDTEYSTTAWTDYMELKYSSDGVNFVSVAQWDEPLLDMLNGDSSPLGSAAYFVSELSLPGPFTSNSELQFHWVTNGVDNNHDGCWVDDVKITKFSDGSDNLYAYSDGTSMAAPHVAGLAALIEGYNPSLTLAQVKNTILTTGDSAASLSGTTVSGKRINAQNALQAVNPAKAITTFTIPSQVGTTTINESAHTIAVTVPFGTNVTALVPTIATSTGSSVSPASGVAQDFTNPVTYTVTAADSSTQAYVVTVTVATNPDITAPVITLNGTTPDIEVGGSYTELGATATDAVDGSFTATPSGSVDTNVVGTYTITYTATDVAGNVATPVIRTINVVAVPVVLNSIAITTPATKLSYTVGESLNITGLVVTGTYSDSSTQIETITNSNITGFDSSVPVVGQILTITVNGKTTTYSITVVAPISSAKAITSFSFAEGNGTIDETTHAITVTVSFGTAVVALTPTVVITGASISPLSGIAQDFTSPVIYTVTAADASTQNYTVTVIVTAPSDLTALNAASVLAQSLHDGATEGTTPGQYAVGSKAILQSAINTASLITSSEAQSVVDAAVINLNAAIVTFNAGLVGPSDLSSLTTAITSAQTLHDGATEGTSPGEYPVGSKATLQSAIDTASLITSSQNQSVVNAAIVTLNSAIATFQASVVGDSDVTALNAAIASAQAIDLVAVAGTAPGQYPASAKTTLETAITSAQTVNASANQLIVDAAVVTLNDAVTDFQTTVIGPSDLSALSAVITSAQTLHDGAVEGTVPGNHVIGSKAIYQTAINNASLLTVSDDQTDIDTAVITLASATTAFNASLVGASDLTALSAVITSAQSLHDGATEGTTPGEYAVGSKAILQTAINTASLITSAEAQSIVNAAITTLNSAVAVFSTQIIVGISGESNETPSTNSVTITWTTTHPATSRVIWDTVSHTNASTTEDGPVNYGYANSTTESATLVTSHSVAVSGLSSGTQYFFRTVSHGSPEVVGPEQTATTATPAPAPAPSGGGGGTVLGATTIKGDINNDKKVDKYDFALMMANWGKTGSNSADLNSDNKVDKYDFALLMSNWSN